MNRTEERYETDALSKLLHTLMRTLWCVTFSSFSCWRWGLWYLENDASSPLQGHTLYFMVLGNGIQHLYMFACVYISTYISPFSKDNCGRGGVNSHFCFLYSWRLHVAKKKNLTSLWPAEILWGLWALLWSHGWAVSFLVIVVTE